jgi:hypothetical protein
LIRGQERDRAVESFQQADLPFVTGRTFPFRTFIPFVAHMPECLRLTFGKQYACRFRAAIGATARLRYCSPIFETTLPAAPFRFFRFQIVTRKPPERVWGEREKNPIAANAGASYGWFPFFEEP